MYSEGTLLRVLVDLPMAAPLMAGDIVRYVKSRDAESLYVDFVSGRGRGRANGIKIAGADWFVHESQVELVVGARFILELDTTHRLFPRGEVVEIVEIVECEEDCDACDCDCAGEYECDCECECDDDCDGYCYEDYCECRHGTCSSCGCSCSGAIWYTVKGIRNTNVHVRLSVQAKNLRPLESTAPAPTAPAPTTTSPPAPTPRAHLAVEAVVGGQYLLRSAATTDADGRDIPGAGERVRVTAHGGGHLAIETVTGPHAGSKHRVDASMLLPLPTPPPPNDPVESLVVDVFALLKKLG